MQVSLTQMPPSLEHLHFFERRDVSHGESLQLRLGGACLRRISVVLPGLRRRDEQGKKRLARAKVCPIERRSKVFKLLRVNSSLVSSCVSNLSGCVFTLKWLTGLCARVMMHLHCVTGTLDAFCTWECGTGLRLRVLMQIFRMHPRVAESIHCFPVVCGM